MIDFVVARDKIAQFQCADDIADFLRYEGVNGVIGQADICPIASWMRITTGAPVCVSVRTMWIDESTSDTVSFDPSVEEKNTQAMTDFVREFDAGIYPDLISPKAKQFFPGD